MISIKNLLSGGILTPDIENFQFVDSLKIMARGMLTIFLVTAILILIVFVLNKYSRKKSEKESGTGNENGRE